MCNEEFTIEPENARKGLYGPPPFRLPGGLKKTQADLLQMKLLKFKFVRHSLRGGG